VTGVAGVAGVVPHGRDPEAYDRLRRRILWMLPTGLYVMGTKASSRRNLMTISWVVQVAVDPKLVGVGVQRDAVTHELLTEGRVFALSLLRRDDRAVVRKFVKPVNDLEIDETTGAGTMQGLPVSARATGAPVLDLCAAWIDCELRHVLELGSHSFFVGEVVDCGLSSSTEGNEDNRDADVDALAGQILRIEDTRMNYGG
jgi:flavin reductase (DIM6/NTAB) family NADH-FMN oxidoreductase RutF